MNYCWLEKKTISRKNLMFFTRQLAILINAGLPLLRGLQILEQQASDKVLQRTLLQLIQAIQGGNTLSDALAMHPKIFDHLYISMVKAGELGGMLGVIFDQLAVFEEKSDKVKNKMTSILCYPAIVLMATGGILGFLLAFIVPKFEAIFADMLHGKSLPLLTQIILQTSRAARDHFLMILLGGSILIAFFTLLNKTAAGAFLIDKIALKIPLLGTLFQKNAIARFARTFGTLVGNGVPMLQALQIAQETSGNRVLHAAISTIHDSVQEGDAMIHPMEASHLFPPMVISMIAVGEETGQLPEMLLKVATIYEEEVDHTTAQLISMMEPLLIVFLALLVGSIVIALFLPLISMISEMEN